MKTRDVGLFLSNVERATQKPDRPNKYPGILQRGEGRTLIHQGNRECVRRRQRLLSKPKEKFKERALGEPKQNARKARRQYLGRVRPASHSAWLIFLKYLEGDACTGKKGVVSAALDKAEIQIDR